MRVTGSIVKEGEEKKGSLVHFRLRGTVYVTRMRCTARHEWQWWARWAWYPASTTPPNSPSQAFLSPWQDEETSCQLMCDSLTLTHSLTRSLPLKPTFLLKFYVSFFPFLHLISLSSLSFPHRSCLFAYWFALCCLSSVSSPPLPVLPFIRCSFFSPWNGSSEVAGTKIEQVVNTCLVSQIMDHLFDKPPFVCIKDTVLGHASERQRTPRRVLLSPFLFTVYTLDFSINSGSWQL